MNTYRAKESKTLWVILLVVATLNLLFLDQHFSYFPYLFIILILLAIFLNYELIIDKGKLTYKIKIFNITLQNKTITPDKIKECYFIKVGEKINVLIKVKEGFRWRLTGFTPESYHADLYEFMRENNVDIQTVNGYSKDQ
ncbi:hypothetical protein [Bacillus sp. FJAT-45350]|uniref:hypothetical protein n=1 Tax=Bacillus sp. FJAT-45350 TaxID=2011014 RepID=UPI000BB863BF|nr:hypothetical protein [Bacillus sp. FJAT-45350]